MSPVTLTRGPMMPTMSPADGGLHLFAAVGLNVPELGDVLLFVLAGVEHAAVRLERAGINPHEVQIAVLVRQ